ncbi:hypothetical protein D9M69_671510 [compost metagenome]
MGYDPIAAAITDPDGCNFFGAFVFDFFSCWVGIISNEMGVANGYVADASVGSCDRHIDYRIIESVVEAIVCCGNAPSASVIVS